MIEKFTACTRGQTTVGIYPGIWKSVWDVTPSGGFSLGELADLNQIKQRVKHLGSNHVSLKEAPALTAPRPRQHRAAAEEVSPDVGTCLAAPGPPPSAAAAAPLRQRPGGGRQRALLSKREAADTVQRARFIFI